MLSTVDMVVQRRDGPRRLRDHDDVDDGASGIHYIITKLLGVKNVSRLQCGVSIIAQ